jgi:hypothetical protein
LQADKTGLTGELEPLSDCESSDGECFAAKLQNHSPGKKRERDCESSDGEDFPTKLRNYSPRKRHKSCLKRILHQANVEFSGFQFKQAHDWCVEEAEICQTVFKGRRVTEQKFIPRSNSPNQHLKRLQEAGYKKIVLRCVFFFPIAW